MMLLPLAMILSLAFIGGVLTWIASNPQTVLALVGTVFTVVRSVEAVWAAKDRRGEALRRAFFQSFTAIEGLAQGAKDQWPPAKKLAGYLEQVSMMLKVMGLPALSDREKDVAAQVAYQLAASKKVPGWPG